MIYLDNDTVIQEVYIPRQTYAETAPSHYATEEYVDGRVEDEANRVDTYYTPTSGFATINGSAITEGGNIVIQGGGGGSYSAGTNISIVDDVISVTGITVPTNVSELNNDSGYITSGSLPTRVSELENDEGYITENDIPENLSDFNNDEGFITSAYTSGFVNEVTYNSGTKLLTFNSPGGQVFQLDCTDFVKDGMVDDVYIDGTDLVIDFNTESGKQDIRIPLSDIFDPSNYYTTGQTDSLLYNFKQDAYEAATGYTNEAISAATADTLTEVDNRIATATASTTGWVESQGYLTEHQSLTAYTPTSGFATVNGSAITAGGNVQIDSSATVELTQAEYDALVSGGTVEEGTIYVITDAPTIDIDDLASNRLSELDELPEAPSNGDLIKYKGTLITYTTGTAQTVEMEKVTDTLYIIRYAYLESESDLEICRMRYSSNSAYDSIYLSTGGTLYVKPSNSSTPWATVNHDGVEVQSRNVSYSYYYYYITWIGNTIVIRMSSNSLNVYWMNPDFTTSGGWVLYRQPEEIVNGNISTGSTDSGIPRWDRYGRVVGRNYEAKTYTYRLNGNYIYNLNYSNSTYPSEMFVPTSSGTSGQTLVSTGGTTPVWETRVKAIGITSADYDALVQAGTTDPNTLYLLTD